MNNLISDNGLVTITELTAKETIAGCACMHKSSYSLFT
jgi:hypothetical protein